NLRLIQENENDKRSAANEFSFDRIVLAYKAFLMKSTEIDKNNVVSERFMEDEILDSEEDFLSKNYELFGNYLYKYCQLDAYAFNRVYNEKSNKHQNWFAESNILISFFSSLGRFMDDKNKMKRVDTAIDSLILLLKNAETLTDPLHLSLMEQLKAEKANPKKYNVGYATRKLISAGFYEYFRSSGEESMMTCWNIS